VEHNAPDKNGERGKTAAARRQQRLRDKKKAAVELLSAAEKQDHPASSIQHPASSAVTSRVTPSVTSRHEENNVTPSLSCSSSISESDSESEPDPRPPDLEALKTRINALRPQTWKKTPHWSAEDEEALYAARQNFAALDEQDWLLLAWFLRWANSSANNARDPVKITARRHLFCQELPAYLDRATATWKQAGAPRLGPPVSPSPRLQVSPSADPPAPNENAFLGLLAAHGGELPANVTTKPHAA
jgi:hypothetical protein